MNVVYDYQIFSYQKYGGISRYYIELFSEMLKINACNARIIAPIYLNSYLKNHNSTNILGKYIPKPSIIGESINKILSFILFHINHIDIVHETYYLPFKLAPRKTKSVITIVDMIYELFFTKTNEVNKLIKNKALATQRADHVICISENTKKDVIEFLGVEPSKISVIYLGSSLHKNKLQLKKPIIDSPYILYVGARGIYKNFLKLLECYACSNRISHDFLIVTFGGPNFSKNEKNEIARLGLNPNKIVHFSGDDDILINLYCNASAFVYPSLYEGFGIPLLEAMSCHCPVVCSNNSSLPEVAGDAAEYFDPLDKESIMAALEKVLYSKQRAEELIAFGIERYKMFSWKKCAKETHSVYSSLL